MFDRDSTAQLLAEGNVTTPASRTMVLTVDDGTVVVNGGAVQPGAGRGILPTKDTVQEWHHQILEPLDFNLRRGRDGSALLADACGFEPPKT